MCDALFVLWEAWRDSPSIYARGVVASPLILLIIAGAWMALKRR